MSSFDIKQEMEYRLIGNTGLKVSVLSLGAMTFKTVDETLALCRTARKYGINFIDNAEGYGDPRGTAETIFGIAYKILKKENPRLWRRSDLVLSTKLYFGAQAGDISFGPEGRAFVGVNESGLTRKHLMEAIDDSLERLQLKYVDLVYAHRPDPLTSIEEIVRSFNMIINSGKAFYWGTSMWKKSQIIEAYWIAKINNLIPPVMEQPIYSMFDRNVVEYEYLDIFKNPYNYGTTIWNVLDRGLLTGKYNKNIPKNARLSEGNKIGAYVGNLDYITKDKLKKVEQLMVIAKELNISMAQLAVGWLIKNSNVTSCILGATKVSQLDDTCMSITAANKLTSKYIDKIEKILNNKPQGRELDAVLRTENKIISRL